jgi:hypothetical protein
MASIRREIFIVAPAGRVWGAARDVGALHTRLVPGFVVDTKLEGDARLVTFGNGMVVREMIIDVDDIARRIAWTTESERMTHYNASFQAIDEDGGTRGVWIVDLLPNEVAPAVAMMVEQGLAAMKRAFEAA